ncbi:MAG: tyrosine-type recombinase/integrase [Dehalococcoidia bacterium]|jgi:integrase/recombinase XerD|nr:tyrosine-type recombinase/integrase [Dehalococcoidia bacterium]
MKQDIAAFLDHLVRVRGSSQNTIAAYRNDLSQLSDFLSAEKEKGILATQEALLLAYLVHLKGKGYSPATSARKVASARSFFKFLVESGRLKENPVRNLASPQVNKKAPRVLTQAEYVKLVDVPKAMTTPESRRDVVMLELLYATGLRATEIVSLQLSDLDLDHTSLWCRHGDSRRQLHLTTEVTDLVREYVTNGRLDLLYDAGETAVFLNRRGHQLTRQGFWQIVKNYASRAGLGDRVTPHTLRHSFAVRKVQSGTDLHALQEALGHAYISSTRVYRQPLSTVK